MAIVYVRVTPSSQLSEHVRVGVVFTAAWQSVDVDAATRTALFTDPFLQASDTDPGGSSGVTINEDNPTKVRTYSALIKRPTAAEFGVGICQIGGVLSVSDGSTWSDVGSSGSSTSNWQKVVTLLPGNTGAANLTLLQTALDLSLVAPGLDVVITGTGVCNINTPFKIPSYTNVTKAQGFTIKQAAGQNSWMMQNKAWDAAVSNVTLTWTSGSLVSIGLANHGLSEGDFAYIHNVAPSHFMGVFRVASVTDMNNFVVRLRRTPTVAPTAIDLDGNTVATSVKFKKADVDINVKGRGFAYNSANNPGNGAKSLNGSFWGCLADSAIDLEILDSWKAPVVGGALNNVSIKSTNYAAKSDLLKIYGPSFDVRGEAQGKAGDDGFTYQTKEPGAFSAGRWCYGDLINCSATGSVIGAGCAFGLYLSPLEYADNITFKDIGGGCHTYISPGIKIWGNISDNIAPITGTVEITSSTALVGTGTDFQKELHIGQTLYLNGSLVGTVGSIASKVAAVLTGGVVSPALSVITGSPGKTSGRFGRISITNSKTLSITGAVLGEGLQVSNVSGALLITDLALENSAADSYSTNISKAAISSVVSKITESLIPAHTGNTVLWISSGCHIGNYIAKECVTNGTANFIKIESGNFVKNIILDNCHLTSGNSPIALLANSSSRPTITVTGSYIEANKLVSCDSALGYDLIIGGNTLDGMYNGITRGGSSACTCTIKSSGNTLLNGSVYSVPLANLTALLYGLDIVADLTVHSKTVKGQMAVSKNAVGTIEAGQLVVCDGTNWRQLSNTTLFY